MVKILLLDIDYTLFCGPLPRPFLKEFLKRMSRKYQLYFYTAAPRSRITDVCRILYHQMGVGRDLLDDLNRYSLSRESCPMVPFLTDAGTGIEVKCLRKAAEKFKVDVSEVRLLDDNPIYDNPDKEYRIQAPGFWGQDDDTYLRDLDI